MSSKKTFLFLIFSLISLIHTEHIEIPLYKSEVKFDEKMEDYVENIEKSNFMTNLKLGTPEKSLPFQIEMTIKDTCVLKDNLDSKTYKRLDTNLQSDKLNLGKKTLNLEMQDYGEVYGNGTLIDKSSGILGLSLDGDWFNQQQTKDHKFVNQLKKNKIVSNSVFYFEFAQEKEQSPKKLDQYLSTAGKLTIGDYPYNIMPKKCDKSKTKTAAIQHFLKSDSPVLKDETNSAILFDMTKCIGCQSCVRACSNIAGQNVLKAIGIDPKNKKKKIVQTTKDIPFGDTNCIACGQCTVGCPKACLKETDDIKRVTEILKNKKDKIVVVEFAPAIRINMPEALGVKPGTISTGKLVTVLKMLGFDYVFDTNFSADMTIVEEATEFVQRLNNPDAVLPMFTSCCPAWVNYVEKVQPEMIPHLSSCKSPLGMLAAVIKNVFPKKIGVDRSKIYHVAVMPCTAKKDEIIRPQMLGDTDAVITSRELAAMVKAAKIDFKSLPDTELDSIYSEASGGGAIFCATGGVMEAAIRAAHKFITGKEMVPINLLPVRGTKEGIKKATVDINGVKIDIAVAHGIKNAMLMLKNIKEKKEGFENIKFAEVMACPGGCVGGGGSPRPKGKKGIDQRIDATYEIDENSKTRTSTENSQLNKLYEEDLGGEYGSHEAHHLLHTYFTNRQVDKTWAIFFKQINFNHTSVTSYFSKGVMKVENNFIIAPNSFLQVLNREFLFLPEIKNKCRLLSSTKNQVVLCDKDLDISKFPTLEFYSDELDHNFVLTGKDLFVYDETYDHLLLLVLLDLNTDNESTWELGLPLLKKELLFFDMDNEQIGVCEISPGTNISLSMIININIVILLIVIAAILSKILMKMPKQRKRRANELLDAYVEEN